MSYNPPTQPGTAPVGGSAQDPGQTMGIVGLILAFVVAPAGIVVSHLARKKSREAGLPDNTLGKVGFILGIVFTVLGVIGLIINIATFAAIMGSGNM